MTPNTDRNVRISSDMMHNQNCHAYLQQLYPFISPQIINLLPGLIELDKLKEQYDANFAYGDLYSYTIAYLENNIESLYQTVESIEDLDNLIYAVYFNNNHILENANWINLISAQTRPRQVNIGDKIAEELVDQDKVVNKLSPMKVESLLSRFSTLFTSNFKPQHDTNLPSIKHFSYNKFSSNLEFRFSTQAQRHNGSVRISPLFKYWLKINAKKYPEEQSICHIYFNNLGLDREGMFDIAGGNEKAFSIELHSLEQDSELKTVVITLPASQALMDSNYYKNTRKNLAHQQVFDELLDIAEGKRHKSGVSDFKISPEFRSILFSNKKNQSQILQSLLKSSFDSMGIREGESLSLAQQQAVWLHFTKFELTDFIINKCTPANQSISYNFSCKDAIDRGALSSIYYNLMKSFKLNRPIQKDEFEQCLDIAAANVKGRGMNFHRKIIWNALDTYINANYDALIKDKRKSWLIYWRDMNCPHARVDQLIKMRMLQCEEKLNQLPAAEQDIKAIGLKLLKHLKEQHDNKVSGQRLMLEVITRTSQLLSHPSTHESITAYKNLATELKINNPSLYLIGGIMEVFLGLILYIPSLGFSKSLLDQGFSLAKTGFFVTERQLMCDEIMEFSLKNPPAVAGSYKLF
ncbi:hypothetical protein [uncultured Legionella sp.]|uniref:hypothetical protein n=1 Tax=uncultured Legionella sp. TaxID=210934 RepID=UPI002633FC2E|nr:hypothetical protein [uncultured Legionella sp.]